MEVLYHINGGGKKFSSGIRANHFAWRLKIRGYISFYTRVQRIVSKIAANVR